MNTLDKMETNPTIRPLLVELLRRLDAGEPLFDGIKRRDLDGCGVRFQARDRIMTLDLNSTFTFPPRTLADAESEAPAEQVNAALAAREGDGARVTEAIQRVREAELFEDGVEADLCDAGITTIAAAFMEGRLDALRELEIELAAREGGVK